MKRPKRAFPAIRYRERTGSAYLILALCFAAGALLGRLACGLMSGRQSAELSGYVQTYARLRTSLRPEPAAGACFACFRQALALTLAGFVAGGVWIVPLLMAGQGFLLSYSVCCFASALGRPGLLCAFAAFGIRCLFVLPCCFFLAERAWSAAGRLRRGERRKRGVRQPGDVPRRYLVCAAVLAAGCAVEITLVPRILSSVLRCIT